MCLCVCVCVFVYVCVCVCVSMEGRSRRDGRGKRRRGGKEKGEWEEGRGTHSESRKCNVKCNGKLELIMVLLRHLGVLGVEGRVLVKLTAGESQVNPQHDCPPPL